MKILPGSKDRNVFPNNLGNKGCKGRIKQFPPYKALPPPIKYLKEEAKRGTLKCRVSTGAAEDLGLQVTLLCTLWAGHMKI